MSKRKLWVYGDADLDAGFEDHLRAHKWINYKSAKQLGLAERSDEFHFQEAFNRGRVLVTHDDGYLDNSRYPFHLTNGVVIIKRGKDWQRAGLSFEKFLRWAWGPLLRDEAKRSVLGYMKVALSNDGFHYWIRITDGKVAEDYYQF